MDGVQAHLATKADADRIDGLEADVATNDDRIDDLEADVASADDRIDGLAERLGETADGRTVEELSEALEAKAERETLERLEADLDALERWAVTDVERRLDALHDATADATEVEASLEELREGKADVWTIDQIRSRIDDLEEQTPDPAELQRLRERVDRAREETADRAAVESIERRLEGEYVGEDDISTTVRAHVDRGLQSIASLSTAIAAVALSFVLAVQNPAEPAVPFATFCIGVAALAYWKHRQPSVSADA